LDKTASMMNVFDEVVISFVDTLCLEIVLTEIFVDSMHLTDDFHESEVVMLVLGVLVDEFSVMCGEFFICDY
jgi:hypothetical protein